MNHTIKIKKTLEDSGVLTDGVTETVRHEIKEQEDRFLGAFLEPLSASLVELVIFAVTKRY